MMFLLVFLVLFVLGVMGAIRPEKFFYWPLLLLFLYPSSTATSHLSLLNGIYFYDSYFFGLFLGVLLKSGLNNFFILNRYVLLLICIFIVYILGFFFVGDREFKYLAKDLRPMLLILEVWLYVSYLNWLKKSFLLPEINIAAINKIVLFVGLAGVFKFIYMLMGGFGYSNEFYEANSYRYLDAATYFCAIYLIFLVHRWLRLDAMGVLAVCVSVLVLILSNSRIILLAVLCSMFIARGFNIKGIIYSLLFIFLGGYVFVFFSDLVGSERVLASVNGEVLSYQIESRFSPFFFALEDFGYLNYFFGLGIGTKFYIPWFEYRTDMSVYNSNIDSMYLTMYTKFGIFCIAYFITLMKIVCVDTPFGRLDKSIVLFFIIIFSVSATVYQIYAIGAFVAWATMRRVASNE